LLREPDPLLPRRHPSALTGVATSIEFELPGR